MSVPPASRWRLIDTTLREGEQSIRGPRRYEDKLALARALDALGVEYLEVTSPAASPRARRELERLARLGLAAKVLAHVRCHLEDVRLALDCGVAGVGLLYATSPTLRRASHGKSIAAIVDALGPPLELALSRGVEVRFSAEDAFRSRPEDVLAVLEAAGRLGAHRVGVADTVGVATPREVFALVARLRAAVGCDIGFHGHDDTGCAVANAFEAVCAGATHVDVSALGLGERVGITSLGGFLARMYSLDPAGVSAKYRLERLPEVDRLAAQAGGFELPFDAYLTGPAAFAHKAGIHLKAQLADPRAYEALPPEVFGARRRLVLGSRLVGRHAVAARARTLGLTLDEEQMRLATCLIKERADEGELSDAEIDRLLLSGAAAATPPGGGRDG